MNKSSPAHVAEETTEPPVYINPVDVLKAIVEEVAGVGQPFSSDSHLPPHLIHDARQAIESAASGDDEDRQAYDTFLLHRLAKANEIIGALRAEIDGLRRRHVPGQPPSQLACGQSGLFAAYEQLVRPNACADERVAAPETSATQAPL